MGVLILSPYVIFTINIRKMLVVLGNADASRTKNHFNKANLGVTLFMI